MDPDVKLALLLLALVVFAVVQFAFNIAMIKMMGDIHKLGKILRRTRNRLKQAQENE